MLISYEKISRAIYLLDVTLIEHFQNQANKCILKRNDQQLSDIFNWDKAKFFIMLLT